MSGGADGIDGVYKKLHERGFEIAGVISKPYRLKESSLSSEDYNVEDIKAFFRQELEIKIIGKGSPKEDIFDKWLDICSKQPLLTKPKSIKLLVLAGFHGVKLTDNGFVRSNEAATQFLTPVMWKLISIKNSITKVYSGNSSNGWADSSIANPEEFNKLGNILVDARDSIPVKKSWYDIKQAMLEALSNESFIHIDDILGAPTEKSAEAEIITSRLLLESKYAEITYADEWNKQAIDERTQLLLSNAWENLTQWLK